MDNKVNHKSIVISTVMMKSCFLFSTETELFPAAQEESEQTRRDPDHTHTLQVSLYTQCVRPYTDTVQHKYSL